MVTHSQAAILDDRAVVAVAGPAARDFLQGILTVDVADVTDTTARHGALLTPQGKILFEFMLAHGGDAGFLFDVARPLAGDLVKRLMFYRLRAKLEIGERPDLAAVAIWGGETAPGVDGAFPDPRLAALGWRAILPAGEASARLDGTGAAIVDPAAYHARRIALGVPELGHDFASGDLFPHEADLDQLAGVDFDKGCFVGQEVVSRMQHRGTSRKRFVPVAVDGDAPAPGSDIVAGGRLLGTTGSVADGRGLALVRLDRLGEALAGGQAIESGRARLTPERPDWARFKWPDGGR